MTFLCLFSQGCSLLSRFVWSTWESSIMVQPSVPRPIGPLVVGGLVSLLHLRLVREGEFAWLPYLCLEKRVHWSEKPKRPKEFLMRVPLHMYMHFYKHTFSCIYIYVCVCGCHKTWFWTIHSVKDFSLEEDCLWIWLHWSCWFSKKNQLTRVISLWNSLHWFYWIVVIYLKESVCKIYYFANQNILIVLSINDSLKIITSYE